MSKKIETLTQKEAKKLVLLSQKIITPNRAENSISATLAAIEHLGYIQIDTISVIQRAHHHTLWNRNLRYQTTHIPKLMADKNIFEYWSHAAAYLPIDDYRFSLPRKQAITNGTQRHWHTPNKTIMQLVLERITKEGPLMAKDFDGVNKKTGDWTTKPTKQALEQLFMQGELMISSRKNFHKVYDLTERILPNHIDTTVPTPEEYFRFLILKYLQVNGLAKPNEMVYLLKNTKPLLSKVLEEMVSNNEILLCNVNNNIYYTIPNKLELLSKFLNRNKLKILSPFDNLLIQRKRAREIFNFDYLIECYVPQAKRKYGYFSLPILWDGNLVARMDCKADRKKAELHIYNLVLEDSLKKLDAFSIALCKELKRFLEFNNCETVQVHKTDPESFKQILEKTIRKDLPTFYSLS